MKRFMMAAGCLFLGTLAHAASGDVWKSSNTLTVESNARLCGTAARPERAMIYSVVVSSSQGVSSFTLCNSTWTCTGVQSIGPIVTTTSNQYLYNAQFDNGLNYTKAGTSAVQVLYYCK